MNATTRQNDPAGGPGGALPPPAPPTQPPVPPSQPPRRSRLWLLIGSLIVVPTLLWSVFNVVLLVAHDEKTITEAVAADGVTVVEVRNPTGRVEVVGSDVEEITIRAEVSHGLRRTGHGHRTDADRLVIWGTCPVIGSSWCEVKYRIEVPRDLAVEVRAATRVELRDLSGPVEARASNGSIETVGLSGPAVLDSTNDDVTVDGHRGDDLVVSSSNGDVDVAVEIPPRSIEARTTNGDVVVALPPDEMVRYRVTVESRNGDRTNEVITDPNADRSIEAKTTNGDATVRYR